MKNLSDTSEALFMLFHVLNATFFRINVLCCKQVLARPVKTVKCPKNKRKNEPFQVTQLAIDLYEHCYWEVIWLKN